MEYLYITVLTLLNAVITAFVVFYASTKSSNKLALIQKEIESLKESKALSQKALQEASRLNALMSQFIIPPDRPAENQIDENINELEFSESKMIAIPKEVKIEVEGYED